MPLFSQPVPIRSQRLRVWKAKRQDYWRLRTPLLRFRVFQDWSQLSWRATSHTVGQTSCLVDVLATEAHYLRLG
jgi:hypothetical protein